MNMLLNGVTRFSRGIEDTAMPVMGKESSNDYCFIIYHCNCLSSRWNAIFPADVDKDQWPVFM